MRILHVSPSWYPASVYGGPIESGRALCCALVERSIQVKVLTTDANGDERLRNVRHNVWIKQSDRTEVKYCRRLMKETVAPMMVFHFSDAARWSDVIHLTAVYSFPTFPTLLGARLLGRPLVWSPRGALQRWKGTTSLRLKQVWESFCRQLAPSSLMLHATSREEAEACRRFSPNSKIAIIPNGVTIPRPSPRRGGRSESSILYLGRLDPKKGVERLLRACARLKRIKWSLTVAGSGAPAYLASLRKLAGDLGIAPLVKFIGHTSGRGRESAFNRASFLVCPSETENFGMVVAEALARRVPVIASKGTPWSGVEAEKCGLWVDNTPESLAAAIRVMHRSPLLSMGSRGRNWMIRDFSWNIIAKQMSEAYGSLVQNQ